MGFNFRFGSGDVRLLAEERSYSGFFQVRKLTLQHRLFGGGWSAPLVREVFERGDAVAVLPYDPVSDSVILIEQFRPGAMRGEDSPWMLELVAGVVEPGETDDSVAHREAMEEAGCELGELVPVASILPSAGGCSEQVRIFCAQLRSVSAGDIHGLQDEGEDILVHRLPRAEALELLRRNLISAGHTVIALQWLQINGAQLRDRWR